MPRFVGDEDHKVIQAEWWEKEETCTIRRFAYGDRQFLAGETLRVGIEVSPDGRDSSTSLGMTEGAEAVSEVAVGRMNLAILERGIVTWTDEDGNRIPVTAARIEALEERDAEYILAEINALNPRRRRTAEEQRGF